MYSVHIISIVPVKIYSTNFAGCLCFPLYHTVVQEWVCLSYLRFQTPPLLWPAPPTIPMLLPPAVAALLSLSSRLLPTRQGHLRHVSTERLWPRLPIHPPLRDRGQEVNHHHDNQLGQQQLLPFLLQSLQGHTNCQILL